MKIRMVLVVLIIGITTLLLESNPVNNVDMATKKKSPTYTEQSYLPDYGPFYNNQGQLPEGFNGPFRSILPADVQGPLAPGQIRSSTPTDFGTNAFASFNDAGTAATTATTSTDYGIKTLPDGRTFDLNNPEQRLAYSQALSQILGVQRDQALAQLDNAFKTNDKQAVNQYQTYLSQLDQNLADIEAGAKKYASDYATTLQGFNEGKQAGDVGRQNYFATISPNAFQSSQASSQDVSNQKYAQGLADLTNQAQSTVGLGYLNDPSQGFNAFAPESQYGRDVSSLNTQRTGLQNQFTDYRTGALQQLQQNQSKVGQSYQDAIGAQNATLGQVDIAQGKNPFQYGLQSVQPYQAPAPDLSQYSQYTNFGQLSNPTATGSTYKAPVSTQNAFKQPQIDQYLQRTNTNLAGGQKDWFTKYLQGKVTA